MSRDDLLLNGMICPITGELFQDPVMTCDGESYEREAIEEWFEDGHVISPATGVPLSSPILIPNLAMRRVIEDMKQRYPQLRDEGDIGDGRKGSGGRKPLQWRPRKDRDRYERFDDESPPYDASYCSASLRLCESSRAPLGGDRMTKHTSSPVPPPKSDDVSGHWGLGRDTCDLHFSFSHHSKGDLIELRGRRSVAVRIIPRASLDVCECVVFIEPQLRQVPTEKASFAFEVLETATAFQGISIGVSSGLPGEKVEIGEWLQTRCWMIDGAGWLCGPEPERQCCATGWEPGDLKQKDILMLTAEEDGRLCVAIKGKGVVVDIQADISTRTANKQIAPLYGFVSLHAGVRSVRLLDRFECQSIARSIKRESPHSLHQH